MGYEPGAEKIEKDWLLWSQRVSFLVIPVVTTILAFTAFVLEFFFNVDDGSLTLFWQALVLYAMPVPGAVAVIAWIKPYAGSIVAFIAIPCIIFYYSIFTFVLDRLHGDFLYTIQQMSLLLGPEVFFLLLGGFFGLAWKKKWKKSKSFMQELRELNPIAN